MVGPNDLKRDFAISQMWNCAQKDMVMAELKSTSGKGDFKRSALWTPCDHRVNQKGELSVMGYSLRTPEWRYTAYIQFDKKYLEPNFKTPLFGEELYDHRSELQIFYP